MLNYQRVSLSHSHGYDNAMTGGIPYPIPTLPVPCASGATVLTWLKRKWGSADVSMALLLIKLCIELYICGNSRLPTVGSLGLILLDPSAKCSLYMQPVRCDQDSEKGTCGFHTGHNLKLKEKSSGEVCMMPFPYGGAITVRLPDPRQATCIHHTFHRFLLHP